LADERATLAATGLSRADLEAEDRRLVRHEGGQVSVAQTGRLFRKQRQAKAQIEAAANAMTFAKLAHRYIEQLRIKT
jgi:hypothetical protein